MNSSYLVIFGGNAAINSIAGTSVVNHKAFYNTISYPEGIYLIFRSFLQILQDAAHIRQLCRVAEIVFTGPRNGYFKVNALYGNNKAGLFFVEPAMERVNIKALVGKIKATDNAFIERLWRSVKQEKVYRNNYQNGTDLWVDLLEYFNHYNDDRPHQSLDYKTPSEVYQPNLINKLTVMNKEKEAKRNFTTITTNESIY